MSNTFKKALLTTTMCVSIGSIASPALAQDAQGQIPSEDVQFAPAEAVSPDAEQEIVVTGTLIRNPNIEASSPIAVIGRDEVELQQANVAEELLRELPGAVPSIGSAVNNGNGGQSFVNLRGIGANRNIVLLDGNRIVPGNLAGLVDLNNIPLALIERTETLTGGASTTYGADAIGGVVNFITRRDFAGIEINASQQITERGDGNRFRVDVTTGANFDDGRGNAVFGIGYQKSQPVYQGARDVSRLNVDTASGAVGGGSGTAVPSRFTGTRPIDPATGLPSTNPAVANGGSRQVDAFGVGQSPFSSFNFNPFNIFQTPFERFNMFGQAHYEVSDGIEVYTRGLFSKNTVDTIIAPSGIFGSSVTLPLSNPFLPAALRAQFCAFDINPDAAIYTPRFTVAECNAAATATDPSSPAFRTVTTNVGRRTLEVGPRISNYVSTVFDYRVGVRGSITDSISFDVNGAYGESQNTQTLQNYTLTSRVRTAVFATNTTTCLAGAVGGAAPDAGPGCVPINLFGPAGSISQASIPFITGESTSTTKSSLAQARATINGDFGLVSPLGEDPIGFAVGVEYREYQAERTSDTLSQTAGELGGSGGAAPNIAGGFNVREAFGELLVPLIQNRPFFEELTLEAGVRYSSYEVDAPGTPTFNTTTYKIGGSWEVGAGVKFRGNYTRAVRAPNIGELFAPVSTGLANLEIDPCATLDGEGKPNGRPNPTGTLRAICLAQGATVGNVNSINDPTAGQLNATGGGNINLKPEVANTYTIGVVFQPEFVPGLSIALDYFNIKVNGAVSSPTTGDAIAACFGANVFAPPAGAENSEACTVIRRNPITGALDGDPATTPGLFLASSNLGTIYSDGADLAINYRRDLGFAGLNLSFLGTYNRNSRFQATPSGLDRECVMFYSGNCDPQAKFQFSQRTTLSFGEVDVSLLWRYIGRMIQEPEDAENGAGPFFSGEVAGFGQQDFTTIAAANYFDLSVRFGVSENLTLTLTAENLLDRDPPLVGASAGSTTFNSGNTFPSTYDALGRRFGASATLRF